MEERVALYWAEGGNTARLHGELDLSSRTRFEAILLDVLECGEGYFAVDLDHLDFMDSQGLHMLSRIRDRSTELDRRFFLLCSGGPCAKVLKIAEADKAFDIKTCHEEVMERNSKECAVYDIPAESMPHRGMKGRQDGG
ncbi:MAG: STAS domain-containing protein [Actinomycetota bacterium]|nr:STAS domain-containing protein [Actinomycetota bacterium]